MYFASFVIGIWPSFFTEVGPDDVFDDLPMLG